MHLNVCIIFSEHFNKTIYALFAISRDVNIVYTTDMTVKDTNEMFSLGFSLYCICKHKVDDYSDKFMINT